MKDSVKEANEFASKEFFFARFMKEVPDRGTSVENTQRKVRLR